MRDNDLLRACVDEKLKTTAESILSAQGLTLSAAINLLLIQVVIQGKLPFPIEGQLKPNARTQALMDASDAGVVDVTEYPDSSAFFAALGVN